MRKRESALKKKMHKILWDFEVQTNNLIPTRRPNLLLIWLYGISTIEGYLMPNRFIPMEKIYDL